MKLVSFFYSQKCNYLQGKSLYIEKFNKHNINLWQRKLKKKKLLNF